MARARKPIYGYGVSYEKSKQAYEMRQQGMTCAQIGRELNIRACIISNWIMAYERVAVENRG